MKQRTADDLVDRLSKVNRTINTSIHHPLTAIKTRELMREIDLVRQEIMDTYDD